MLTPSFELQQNDEFILLQINAPYIKANDVEIYIDDREFKFYVKPYFLRLRFQKEIVEDGRETASYDISKGVFDIKIPKKNLGEHFPDLNMLTTLLAVKKTPNGKPLIEEMDKEDDKKDEDEIEDDEFSWEWEQTPYQPLDVCLQHKYGFANQTSGVFTRLQDELYEIVDLPDPDNTSLKDRRTMRTKAELKKFDEGHYMADYFEDEMIQELMKFVTPWQKEYERILEQYKGEKSYPETNGLIEAKGDSLLYSEETNITFTADEKYTLLKIPNKNYLLSKEEEQVAWLGLVDVMFAYCYNYRTTEGEGTSESAWTICKLSSTFSWLDSFTNLHDVIESCYCRCLCYPLYRHWSLVNRVFKDLQLLFSLGKSWILRCLLDIRKILLASDNRYIINDLYVSHYIVWIQKQKASKLRSLSNRLNVERIVKTEMPFNIETIELVASMENLDTNSISNCEKEETEDSSSSNSEDEDESSIDSDDSDDEHIVCDELIDAEVTATPQPPPPSSSSNAKIEVISSTDFEPENS